MTSKLDAMKAALADYDAKMASIEEEYRYWSSRNAAAFAPDYLRTLLAVADAALAVEDIIGYQKASSVGNKKKRLQALLNALKALD